MISAANNGFLDAHVLDPVFLVDGLDTSLVLKDNRADRILKSTHLSLGLVVAVSHRLVPWQIFDVQRVVTLVVRVDALSLVRHIAQAHHIEQVFISVMGLSFHRTADNVNLLFLLVWLQTLIHVTIGSLHFLQGFVVAYGVY